MDALKNHTISQVLVAVMNIWATLADHHGVEELLGSVPVLVDQADLKVEVSLHLLDTLGKEDWID